MISGIRQGIKKHLETWKAPLFDVNRNILDGTYFMSKWPLENLDYFVDWIMEIGENEIEKIEQLDSLYMNFIILLTLEYQEEDDELLRKLDYIFKRNTIFQNRKKIKTKDFGEIKLK